MDITFTDNKVGHPDLNNKHIDSRLLSEDTIPIDGLPATIQAIILAVAEAYGCPRDFVTLTVFIAIGTVVGKKSYVNYHNGKYINYLSIWGAVVNFAGGDKSPATSWIMRPLMAINKRKHQFWLEKIRKYQKLSIEEKNEEERPIWNDQLVMTDSTPEARNQVMSYGNGILVYAEELKAFFDSMGAYKTGGKAAAAEVARLI